MKNLIEMTTWVMDPPKAYHLFHLLFMLCGFSVSALLAWKCRKISEKAHRILLLSVGIILMLSEVYKQLFYYYHIGEGTYQWWIFPFQLCSVPMYLCVLAALIKPGKVQNGMYYFMCSYNLLGGAIAFLEPSGLCHEYWTLTLHAFVWHQLLVFVGLYLVFSGRGCKKKEDYKLATWTFLALCAIAFAINLIFYRVADHDINMFFIGPSKNPLIIFKSIAEQCGWYVATLVYIPVVCLGAWLVYLGTKAYYNRKRKEDYNDISGIGDRKIIFKEH